MSFLTGAFHAMDCQQGTWRRFVHSWTALHDTDGRWELVLVISKVTGGFYSRVLHRCCLLNRFRFSQIIKFGFERFQLNKCCELGTGIFPSFVCRRLTVQLTYFLVPDRELTLLPLKSMVIPPWGFVCCHNNAPHARYLKGKKGGQPWSHVKYRSHSKLPLKMGKVCAVYMCFKFCSKSGSNSLRHLTDTTNSDVDLISPVTFCHPVSC